MPSAASFLTRDAVPEVELFGGRPRGREEEPDLEERFGVVGGAAMAGDD